MTSKLGEMSDACNRGTRLFIMVVSTCWASLILEWLAARLGHPLLVHGDAVLGAHRRPSPLG